ncbi:MAG: ABC transporter transmembrane domain-containing protein, partial [Armatimonadota bacterium]
MSDKRPVVQPLGSMMGPGPGRGPGGMLAPGPKVENVREVLTRLWSYLRRYRAGLLWVTVLVTASTVLTLVNPYLISLAFDRCLTPHHMEYLAGVIWMMIAAHVLASVGTWGQTVVMIHLSQQTLRDLRRDLFSRLGVLPLRFFDTHAHGEVMSRLTNDTETINGALAQTVTQLLSSVLTVVGAGVAMALLNWRLA